MVGHAHFENGDAQALNPVAETVLAVPFGVPIGEKEDGRAGTGLLCGKELGVHGVVFRPGRFEGTGKGEYVCRFKCGRRATGVKVVIGGGGGGVPIPARFDGILGVSADEGTGIGLVKRAADVLKAPVKGLDAAIVVGGPAAVLVAADSAFEPVHDQSRQFTVYSQELAKKKADGLKEGKRRISTQNSQRSTE